MNISGPEVTAGNAATSGDAQSFDWVKLASGALSLVNQQRIAQINIKRAQQGLPPITLEDVPGATPVVQVGVERSTRDLLLWGGVGALALFGLRSFLKRR